MVNNVNLSSYTGPLPISEDSDRKISNGPLYDRDWVLSLLDQGEKVVVPWTKKCISDIQKYNLDHSDIIDLLKCALTIGKFKGSEWCINKPGGAWAACDSYQVFRSEWVRYANKNMQCEYYVKFAVNNKGSLILTVSCHLSEDR